MGEEKVREVAWRLLGKVEEAVEAVEIWDRGGMKQLTGVLKELDGAGDTGITVMLLGEAEEFAG